VDVKQTMERLRNGIDALMRIGTLVINQGSTTHPHVEELHGALREKYHQYMSHRGETVDDLVGKFHVVVDAVYLLEDVVEGAIRHVLLLPPPQPDGKVERRLRQRVKELEEEMERRVRRSDDDGKEIKRLVGVVEEMKEKCRRGKEEEEGRNKKARQYEEEEERRRKRMTSEIDELKEQVKSLSSQLDGMKRKEEEEVAAAKARRDVDAAALQESKDKIAKLKEEVVGLTTQLEAQKTHSLRAEEVEAEVTSLFSTLQLTKRMADDLGKQLQKFKVFEVDNKKLSEVSE